MNGGWKLRAAGVGLYGAIAAAVVQGEWGELTRTVRSLAAPVHLGAAPSPLVGLSVITMAVGFGLLGRAALVHGPARRCTALWVFWAGFGGACLVGPPRAPVPSLAGANAELLATLVRAARIARAEGLAPGPALARQSGATPFRDRLGRPVPYQIVASEHGAEVGLAPGTVLVAPAPGRPGWLELRMVGADADGVGQVLRDDAGAPVAVAIRVPGNPETVPSGPRATVQAGSTSREFAALGPLTPLLRDSYHLAPLAPVAPIPSHVF